MGKGTVREHLASFHEASAAHHAMLAANFTKLAGAIGKSEVAGPAKSHIEAIAAAHEEMSTYHSDACAECEKAQTDAMDKIVPTNISRVVPTHPNIKAVPRGGQPAPPTPVDPAFAHLVKVSDDEE